MVVTVYQLTPVYQLGPKKDTVAGRSVRFRTGFTPTRNPANSAALNAASNRFRERSNPSTSLHEGAAGPAHEVEREGWAHKRRPTGKPPDTLTGPRRQQRQRRRHEPDQREQPG